MAKEYDIFQMYVNEMSAIAACDAAENEMLAQKAAAGDEVAKKRLIEGNLKYVLELSRDYVGSGVPASDLVQEANMALLMAVEEYDPESEAVTTVMEATAASEGTATSQDSEPEKPAPEKPASESSVPAADVRFGKYLEKRVKEALTAAVDEHKAQKKISRKVLNRVNQLQDVSKVMAEELGREATVPELAKRLKMTEDEVKDTMKVALDALKALGED